MPTKDDCDEFGMIRMQVQDRQGRWRVKKVPAVDARELILCDAGTLDLDPAIAEQEAERERNRRIFKDVDLEELRWLAKKHDLPFAGKTELELALDLSEADVSPDELSRTGGDEEDDG